MKALMALAGCLTTTVSLLGVSWCHCCHLWGQVRCAPHPNHQSEAKGPREARSSCAARETRRGRRPGPDPSPAPHGPHTPPPAAFAWHPAWLGARARWIKAQAPACGRQAPSYSGPHLAGCPSLRHKPNLLQPHSDLLPARASDPQTGSEGAALDTPLTGSP